MFLTAEPSPRRRMKTAHRLMTEIISRANRILVVAFAIHARVCVQVAHIVASSGETSLTVSGLDGAAHIGVAHDAEVSVITLSR